MGFEFELFLLLLRSLKKLVSRAIRPKADEDADLFYILQCGIELIKATNEKIPDQAIKLAGIRPKQNSEAISKAISRFVSQKRQIR